MCGNNKPTLNLVIDAVVNFIGKDCPDNFSTDLLYEQNKDLNIEFKGKAQFKDKSVLIDYSNAYKFKMELIMAALLHAIVHESKDVYEFLDIITSMITCVIHTAVSKVGNKNVSIDDTVKDVVMLIKAHMQGTTVIDFLLPYKDPKNDMH